MRDRVGPEERVSGSTCRHRRSHTNAADNSTVRSGRPRVGRSRAADVRERKGRSLRLPSRRDRKCARRQNHLHLRPRSAKRQRIHVALTSPGSISYRSRIAISFPPFLEARRICSPLACPKLLGNAPSLFKHRSGRTDNGCRPGGGCSQACPQQLCDRLIESPPFLLRAKVDVFDEIGRKIEGCRHVGKFAGSRRFRQTVAAVQHTGRLPTKPFFIRSLGSLEDDGLAPSSSADA